MILAKKNEILVFEIDVPESYTYVDFSQYKYLFVYIVIRGPVSI